MFMQRLTRGRKMKRFFIANLLVFSNLFIGVGIQEVDAQVTRTFQYTTDISGGCQYSYLAQNINSGKYFYCKNSAWSSDFVFDSISVGTSITVDGFIAVLGEATTTSNASFYISTGDSLFPNGTAASPSVAGINYDTSGVYWSAGPNYNISVDGVLAATFDDSQNTTLAGNVTLATGTNRTLTVTASGTSRVTWAKDGGTNFDIFNTGSKAGLDFGGSEGITFLSGYVAVNSDSLDIDFKVRSDANANFLDMDAGLFSGIGAVSFGGDASVNGFVRINPPAMTAPVSTQFAHLLINPGGTTIVPAGTSTVVATATFEEPGINCAAGGGASNCSVAVTLYVKNAPDEGTDNYALFSDGGLNRFDGDGTHIFEIPADATDPTSGGGAATGRIPVKIGGATVYIPYY
jgi:hypothetical protein